jgi:hypothetical protein
MLKVVDLFAGLRGWSIPWEERGHLVFSTDIDEMFDVDLHADILDLTIDDFPFVPQVVLASPPCEAFSVLTIGKNWTGPDDDPPHHPKTEAARYALSLVEKTVSLINDWRKEGGVRFFVIENPRAKLRKLPIMSPFERRTVTYCQYGEPVMKPTDLWSDNWPPSLRLKEPCRNGAPCHIRAPRGSTTGTQGGQERMDELAGRKLSQKEYAAMRAKIPRLLSLEICEAVERDYDAMPDKGPIPMPWSTSIG